MTFRDIAVGAGLLWFLFRKRDDAPSPGLDAECWKVTPEGCYVIGAPCGPGESPVSLNPPGQVCGAVTPGPETPVAPDTPTPSVPCTARFTGGGGLAASARRVTFCLSHPECCRNGVPIAPQPTIAPAAFTFFRSRQGVAPSGPIEGYFSAAPGPSVLSMGFLAGRRR